MILWAVSVNDSQYNSTILLIVMVTFDNSSDSWYKFNTALNFFNKSTNIDFTSVFWTKSLQGGTMWPWPYIMMTSTCLTVVFYDICTPNDTTNQPTNYHHYCVFISSETLPGECQTNQLSMKKPTNYLSLCFL